MELIAWAIQVQLYKYRTFRIAPQEKVSSQCLTLGSRKLNYNAFDMKNWIPASRAGMTSSSISSMTMFTYKITC
ncbi:hypothetical protein [Wolbachia endosymbiont of Dactylopius coccus]